MNGRVDAVLRGLRRLLLSGAIVLATLVPATLVGGPGVAAASTDYWVEACGPSAADAFSFVSSDPSNLVGSDSACGSAEPGLAVSDLAGADEPEGATAFWAVAAPPGETIQALLYTGGSFTTTGGGWIAGWQGDTAGGDALTPAVDPDAADDCNSSQNQLCSASNAESLMFGPGVGVGPLAQLALAIACENASCPAGGASADVSTAHIELVDPNDTPTVEAAVSSADASGGYDSATSELSLTYQAVDPGGICSLEAALVSATGALIASTEQGTVTPAQDPTNLAFTSTLPCGGANTNVSNATAYTFAPNLAGLPNGAYRLEILAANPGEISPVGGGQSVVWQSSAISVDNSTPTVSISTDTQPGTWSGSPQQLAITATDAGSSSGVGEIICSGPGAPGDDQPIQAAQFPFTITVPGSGAQTVSCHAVSNSGISSPTKSMTVNVDTQSPATTLAGADPAPAVLPSPEAVTIAASEPQAASGIKSTTCSVTDAGGPPQTYTIAGASGQLAAGDFSDGKSVISCQATSNAGITGQTASETLQIDDQQPVVTFAGASPAPAWVTGHQQVTATAAEPRPPVGFGVASVSCQVNGGAWKSASADHQSLDLSGTGTYDVACAATSAAGVQGPTATERIQIDDALPTGGRPVVRGDRNGATGGWSHTPQRVTLTFTAHGGAAISEVRCRVQGRQLVFKPGHAGVAMGAGGTTETVTVTVRAPGGTLVCQGLSSAGKWAKPVSRSLEIDAKPPTGHFDPMNRRNPTQVRALVTDSGSGVASARIEIEERSGWKKLATRYDKSSRVATAFVPDDGSIPNGSYTLRVDASDVAGNTAMLDSSSHGKLETVTLPLRQLTRLSAVVSAGQERVAAVAEAAGAPARRPHTSPARRLTLSYGERSRLTGRLTTDRGKPIGGAPILLEQVVSGSAPKPVARLRTDSAGQFGYAVPVGPTRTLEIVYGGTRVLRTTTATASLRVAGRATVSAGNRPVAGRQLTIGGRVLGGWIPTGGVLVQLWYEIEGDGRGWAPFEHAIHTDRNGSWRLTFPVSVRAGGYTYKFRAVVSRQAGWPFLATTSEIVTRTVATL